MNSYIIAMKDAPYAGADGVIGMNIAAFLYRPGLAAIMLIVAMAAPPVAFAQSAMPVGRAAASGADTAKPTEKPRAARERSPAQKANDERMRACGAEWRAKKTELAARGETWRKFSVDCRARLKAKGA